MEDKLILVNLNDEEIGTCGKMQTHEEGRLHRAFSVFVFWQDSEEDSKNPGSCKLLIQKRAKGKYHSGGKWANSCCSHPRHGETIQDAVSRRLPEETGINAAICDLREEGSFVYRAEFANGLSEYEYDHVFTGLITGKSTERDYCFARNPEEAEEMQFVDIEWLCQDVLDAPGKYAPWFITALPIALKRLQNK